MRAQAVCVHLQYIQFDDVRHLHQGFQMRMKDEIVECDDITLTLEPYDTGEYLFIQFNVFEDLQHQLGLCARNGESPRGEISG